MKTWLRLLLVIVSVGGGLTGILLAIAQTVDVHSAAQVLLLILFLGLYGFVTVSGLLFAHDVRRTTPLAIALALQIPWVSCPWFVYEFASGVWAAITVGEPAEKGLTGLHFGWNLLFGAHFQVTFGSSHYVPISLGVNAAAMLLSGLLMHANRSADQTTNRLTAMAGSPESTTT